MDRSVKILIVDDESSQRAGLAGMVKAWGMLAETACDGSDALDKVAVFNPDVIVTDLNMPHMDGYELLQALREQGDMPPTIVLTAYGNIETALRTVHEMGAYWFIEKPIQPNMLLALLRKAAAHQGLHAEKRVLERQLQYKGNLGQMVGKSPRIQEIFSVLQQAGPSRACVLISGESGTGKELVARTVHALSPRRQGPFVAINCAALPETLIESELFGHEKGSFTGATERRAGCFEIAQGGTLLLDEIGEMPLATQAKLLRILEDSKVRRLGGKVEFEVDVRVVAATNKVPDEAVKGGHLREDLFYRLNVFHIHLPSLRERKEDIPAIAEALILDLNRKHDTKVTGYSGEVGELFEAYDWPGNIRELRNVLERSVILTGQGEIQAAQLPSHIREARSAAPKPRRVESPAEATPPPAAPVPVDGASTAAAVESNVPQPLSVAAAVGVSLPQSVGARTSEPDTDAIRVAIGTTVEEAEKGLILRTLEHTRNNKTRAAEILGISLKTLHNKLKEYGARESA
jgi:DNA-binding NtrC family response regulator